MSGCICYKMVIILDRNTSWWWKWIRGLWWYYLRLEEQKYKRRCSACDIGKKKSVKQNDEEDMQLLMADSLDEINDDCAEYWWEGDKGKLSHEARRTSALFWIRAVTTTSSHSGSSETNGGLLDCLYECRFPFLPPVWWIRKSLWDHTEMSLP